MRGYPQLSFWISIAPDMIYLSHIVIIWEKYFPLVGIVLKPVDCIECQKKKTSGKSNVRFRIALEVVFVSMQITHPFAYFPSNLFYIILVKAEFFHVNLR